MAVQKSRKSRSRRGMRRAHDALSAPAVTLNQNTGEIHRRHHVSKSGEYKGRQIINTNPTEE
jgi:large subunit ribosomal protein L32